MTTSLPSWNNDPATAEPRPGGAGGADLGDYEDFFRGTYADTVRHLVRRGHDAETAADCAQEAYVRAYARWWRLRRYDDPAGWVRRVAVNVAIDTHRKTDRHRRALPTLAAEVRHAEPPPREPDGFRALSARLPGQQRRVVELCYGEDLSAEQAAGRLGITAGAVRFHLTRARDRLRPALSAERRAEEAR